MSDTTGTLHAHLRLSRLSNLPTVWSNCVAASALSGGEILPGLFFLTFSMSLIYIGGMYLNDAYDAEFDASYRPDRPIPAGDITRREVFFCGYAFIGIGLAICWWWGIKLLLMALLLSGTVVAYDVLHKHTSISPLIMGVCRALVYLTVAVGVRGEITLQPAIWAMALLAYVTALSFFAKVEEANIYKRFVPLSLIVVPPLILLWGNQSPTRIFLALIFTGWILYCLFLAFNPRNQRFGMSIAGLIAAISLVDLLAVTQVAEPLIWQLLCAGSFALTLFGQRYVQGT